MKTEDFVYQKRHKVFLFAYLGNLKENLVFHN